MNTLLSETQPPGSSQDFASNFAAHHHGVLRRDEFISTQRRNPCVLCGNTSGKCREVHNLRLCMEYTTGYPNIPGYRFKGLTKDGLWGIWVVDDGVSRSDTDRDQWWKEQQTRRYLRKQAEAEQCAQALPALERDRQYRRLLSLLTLHHSDRTDLHQRGLSEAQIKVGGFVSVEQWQTLPEEFPITLPGINWDGQSLNVPGDGYLCPIRDVDGFIVGCQLRLRSPEDRGRYRWLSSRTKKRPNGQPPKLPNGELPLAVFRPEAPIRQAIALVEGVGPKPFITSQKLNVITVGAAGGLFAASPQTLQITMERLTADVGTNRIEFFPDAGALENPNVLRQYKITWDLLEQAGYSTYVGWWGQVSKSDLDIDELEDVEAIAFLSPKAFLALAPAHVAAKVAAHPQPVGANPVKGALSQERQQQERERYQAETDRIMTEFNSLRVEPTLTLSGRYIPSGLLQLPQTAGTVLIDGPMGVGKTSTALKELVQQHRQQHPTAFRCLLTPRNALGRQSAAVLGLPHHTTMKGFGLCPNEVTLCPESGWRFPTKRLPNGPPLILIDEGSQLLYQLLEGKTSGQNHALNLHWLRSIFQWVKQQGGWIVLSEDGITNLEIDLIAQASGLEVVQFLKFEHTNSSRRDITLFNSSSLTWTEIKKRLSKGENLVIASDSARWLRQTREMAIAAGITPEAVCIIDSESSSEEWAQQLSTNPDQWIAKHRPRILGYSPTFQQGISITDPNGHFQAMAIHLVHLDWRSAKQMPERLRTNVPRFGYVKPCGTRTNGLFNSCRPEVIVRDFYHNVAGVGTLTQFVQYAQSKGATDADGNPLDLVEAISQLKDSQHDPDSDFGFWLRHYARYQARSIYNRLTLRDSLVGLWKSRGCTVQIIEGIAKAEIEERQQIEGKLVIDKASDFAQLDTGEMSVAEARAILEELASTQEQRDLAHKRLLQDKLPGVDLDNPQFVLKTLVKDNGRFLKTAELLWMTQNSKAAQWLDRWTWMNEFTQATRRGQFVSYNRLSFRSAQAKLMNECPLQPFMEGKLLQWDNNSPEVISVHDWALRNRDQFRRYLRLTIAEDHPSVRTVNKLLRKLGYQVKQVGWKGSREDRERQYSITNLEDADRDAILKALEERFIKHLNQKEGIPDPEAGVSVIAACIEISPLSSCDHLEKPDWSKCPSEVLEILQTAWAEAENEHQRQVILDTILEYTEAMPHSKLTNGLLDN